MHSLSSISGREIQPIFYLLYTHFIFTVLYFYFPFAVPDHTERPYEAEELRYMICYLNSWRGSKLQKSTCIVHEPKHPRLNSSIEGKSTAMIFLPDFWARLGT